MSHLRQPVCVKCARTMRCEKNDFPVVKLADGAPYKLHYGDKWKCHGCGFEVAVGFGAAIERFDLR